MQPTIIIDAGHGGFDNGASFQGRREKDDTLRLALAVGERLETAGFPVVFTRNTDVYQNLLIKRPLPIKAVEIFLFRFIEIPVLHRINTMAYRPWCIVIQVFRPSLLVILMKD